MSVSKNVIIIGGGVNGITTALTLQLMGFNTTCIAEYLVEKNTPADPKFASLYPVASIIPHSVRTDKLNVLFPASLAIYNLLLHEQAPGMIMHRHFELFEFSKETPDYAQYLQNFSLIHDAPDQRIPHRSKSPDLHGWVFDCLVTEWPDYMHQLYKLYNEAGGTIKRKKLEQKDIPVLEAEIIINCSGIWSRDLFPDKANQAPIRGHLVHILDKKPILDSRNRILSYNYSPETSVYATPDGSHSDLYFYPKENCWVLGGSRQQGSIDKYGNWVGPNHDDTIDINNIDIPKPILTLNAEILEQTYGLKQELNFEHKQARMGYRYSRSNTKNGLRLEATENFDKKIIHNYGHGGAGVCLSWGCALYVYHLVKKETDAHFSSMSLITDASLIKSLQVKLEKVYWKHIHT